MNRSTGKLRAAWLASASIWISGRGKRVVLYFYPKANTPGCTTESCEFRDDVKAFAKKGTTILGISPDKPASQMKFKEKYSLPFTLLADHDKTVAQAFGVGHEHRRSVRAEASLR